MSAPIVAASPPPGSISLDPGVAYKYVIPAQNETGISHLAVFGWSVAIVGRTATVTYVGTTLGQDTSFTHTFNVTNNDGTTKHDVVFRVKGGAVRQVDASIKVGIVNGSKDFKYLLNSPVTNTQVAIRGCIVVGTKLKAVSLIDGTAPTSIPDPCWVVRVDDSLGQFRISATQGGSEFTPDQDAHYYFVIDIGVNGSPNLFVGGSALYNVGDQFSLSYNDSAALPSAWVGTKFVKSIVDAYRITLANTLGGAAVNANADSHPTDQNARLVVDTTGNRYFPAIISASEQTLTEETLMAPYAVTADIAVDSFAVQGLPDGLSFDGANTISGTPSAPMVTQAVVTLIAYKNGTAQYRFLLLNRAGGAAIDLEPDARFDLGTKKFYMVSGPAGRADRLEHQLGAPSILFAFDQYADEFTLPAGSTVRLRVKKALGDGADLISASRDLTSARSKLAIGEDWTDAAVIALFNGALAYYDLWIWLEWKFPGEARYRKSNATPLRLSRADESGLTTSTPIVTGALEYLSYITRLTGGVSATDLDALPIAGLANKTVIRVVIDGEGESAWRKEPWTGSGAPVTDAAGGLIVPPDYNAATMNYVLNRVSGA